MAEWSIAAVLKTVDLRGSGGSNPSLSAKKTGNLSVQVYLSKQVFCFAGIRCLYGLRSNPSLSKPKNADDLPVDLQGFSELVLSQES